MEVSTALAMVSATSISTTVTTLVAAVATGLATSIPIAVSMPVAMPVATGLVFMNRWFYGIGGGGRGVVGRGFES